MNKIDRIERRLKLHDVRVLMSVVETGSMGKAAEQLGTSQPAISRTIAELEHALGVRLLDRSSRGIEPTQYGRAMINRGVAIFDELHQSIKDMERLADPTTGELRIGASIALAVGFASPIIDRLARRHPRMSFDLLAVDTAAACRAVEARVVDLALVHMIEPLAEGLKFNALYREPHIVAAASKNPWTRRRGFKLADLLNEPWTLPALNTQFGAVVRDAFRANGLEPPRTVVTSSLPVRNALLATGHFLTMAPRVVLSAPNSLGLKALPIDLPSTRSLVEIITLKGRTLSPLARLFIERARKMAKSLAEGKIN